MNILAILLNRLLINNESTRTMIADLGSAGDDAVLLQRAWLPILQQLNASYYMARDNTKKFHSVTPLIDDLVKVTEICIKQLNGQLANNALLAEEATQLHFKVSNYYSLASTVDSRNYDLCSQWLKKAEDFIQANGLAETKNHAILHNLIGGHESRGFVMGLLEVFPHSCVEHFQEAARIHNEKLDSKLENVKDVELRHVLMCLAHVTAQEAFNKVLLQGAVTADIKLACDATTAILDQLSDDVLLLPKDGSPDYYRRAGCLHAKAYVALLLGDFLGARTAIEKAEETMEASIAITGATGQLSLILNDVDNIHVAFGTAKALKSKQLSQGQFEDMYAKEADKQLASVSSNRFSQLARIIVRGLAATQEDVVQSEVGRLYTPGFVGAAMVRMPAENDVVVDPAVAFKI